MTLVLGVDIGTTTITCLAMDTSDGDVVVRQTIANDARITAGDQAEGASEWDAEKIIERTCVCLSRVVEQIRSSHDIVGIGVTGQQHGVVMVDESLNPVTAFISWQDRRAETVVPGLDLNYVEHAQALLGTDAQRRAGCRLSAGYMGTTLFWLQQHKRIQERAKACFIMDLFASRLTGNSPVSDPSSAASSGLLNVELEIGRAHV